jgi:hypothetical protein
VRRHAAGESLEHAGAHEPTDVTHWDAEVVDVVLGYYPVMGTKEWGEAVVQAEHGASPIDRRCRGKPGANLRNGCAVVRGN